MKCMLSIFSLVIFVVNTQNISFYLTTPEQQNRQSFAGNRYGNLIFAIDRKYVVLCHGFASNEDTPWYTSMTKEYLLKNNTNIISVGYRQAASNPFTIFGDIPKLGRLVGEMVINLIQNKGINAANFHIIGHSIGAHVAGIGGRTVKNSTSKQISRVTGLDPATPDFIFILLLGGISKNDATFVDIIHTSIFGIPSPIGHVDFYPNGSPNQPGCHKDILCNHVVSTQYFALSINHNYTAVECGMPMLYFLGLCKLNRKVLFGDPVDHKARGKYFLKFNASIGQAVRRGDFNITTK